MDSDAIGTEAYELMERLFPLCRSLTGSGVRATFDVLEEHVPLDRTEIASGTQVFDWTVPDEWNIRDAYIADARRESASSTSAVRACTSCPTASRCATRMSLEALRERLHTLPDQPDLVPYRTSYYHRTWGFCLSHRQLLELQPGEYDVVIDSTLEPGHLTYGEVRLEGESEDEVLISTYVCHPSLANDNLSGIAVATMLARQLSQRQLRHSYRFLFAPGTIGPLAWLHQNRDTLHRVKHGLAVSCIGDAGGFTYKRSRRGDRDVDRAVELVLRDSGAAHRIVDWEPWGGDERQFCSPGFDLPVGCLMRTPHGGFDGYHTSADGLDRIRPESLGEAVRGGLDVVEILETNGTYTNLSPYGEPQLGRRGLYRSSGGAVESPDDERALLWVLNLSDGRRVAARHRRPVGAVLRGHPASGGATGAGRASGAPDARLVIGPRPISLRDDPLLRRRPLDSEGGVVPAHATGRLRDVLVRHLVRDLGVVDERLVALGEALRDVEEPAVLRAELDAEPLQVGRASRVVGRRSSHERRRECTARASPRRAERSWKCSPRSVSRSGLKIVLA